MVVAVLSKTLHHSGFSVHAGNQIARDDRDGQKALLDFLTQLSILGFPRDSRPHLTCLTGREERKRRFLGNLSLGVDHLWVSNLVEG